jgi:hypothetical protein
MHAHARVHVEMSVATAPVLVLQRWVAIHVQVWCAALHMAASAGPEVSLAGA